MALRGPHSPVCDRAATSPRATPAHRLATPADHRHRDRCGTRRCAVPNRPALGPRLGRAVSLTLGLSSPMVAARMRAARRPMQPLTVTSRRPISMATTGPCPAQPPALAVSVRRPAAQRIVRARPLAHPAVTAMSSHRRRATSARLALQRSAATGRLRTVLSAQVLRRSVVALRAQHAAACLSGSALASRRRVARQSLSPRWQRAHHRRELPGGRCGVRLRPRGGGFHGVDGAAVSGKAAGSRSVGSTAGSAADRADVAACASCGSGDGVETDVGAACAATVGGGGGADGDLLLVQALRRCRALAGATCTGALSGSGVGTANTSVGKAC